MSGGDRPPETGWLADTPVDDNVIRGFLANQADYGDILAERFGGTTARTPDVALAASRCVVPYLNEALLLRPILDAADPVLDEIEGFFAASDASGWILLSAWPTPSLRERGWELVGHPAFVLRTPGIPLRPPADRPEVALEVRRATTPEDIRAAEEVMVDGYPMEEAQGRPGSAFPEDLWESDISVRIASVLDPDGSRMDVAVGLGYVAHGVVNLCGAATLPAARRTGAWGALVRARVDDAPHLPAVAFTSDFSRPGFEHLGFVSVLRCTMWASGRKG